MTDRSTVVMPRLGESIVEGTIARYAVRVGDRVEKGQILAEVETDKATSEIPSPLAGVIAEIVAVEGSTIEVGAPMLRIAESADPSGPGPAEPDHPTSLAFGSPRASADPSSRPRPAEPDPSDGRLEPKRMAPRPEGAPSSPAVRRLAREHRIDLEAIDGSGRRGRVTREDLLRTLERSSVPPPVDTSEASPFPTELPAQAQISAFRPPVFRARDGDQVVPFSRRRDQIAAHMIYSLRTSAHVFAVAEVDMGHVARAKERDAAMAESAGVRLTFLPYVVAAVARALGEHPSLNAEVADKSLVLRRDKNIGIAVDTEEGLVVPVIHRADELGVVGIGRRIDELAAKARRGELHGDDVSGGSFTISNPGRKGNLFGLSIIRQPEVAILRLGAMVKRPVVREVDGEDVIVVRPMMYAALSYDHRVIDGRTANDFLFRVTELLQG